MATNKTIYFNDEMQKMFELLEDETGMKAGKIVKEGMILLSEKKKV